MYRKTIILFIIFSTLFNTGCTLKQNKSKVNEVEIHSPSISKEKINLEDKPNENKQTKRDYNTVEIPIVLMYDDIKEDKNVKYLKIKKNTTLEEKINKIVSVVSSECFSNLPIKVKIYGNDTAKIDLLEFDNGENNRVSWSENYLNNSIKEHTIRVLLENILQEEYNGKWIKKVQLYYEGELLSID